MTRANSIIPPVMPPAIAPIGVLQAGAPITGVDDARDIIVSVDGDDSEEVVVETPLS